MEPLAFLRRYRRPISIVGHLALVSFAYFLAYALRFDFRTPPDQLRRYIETLPYLLVIRLALFHRSGLFRGYWHLVGVRDLRQIVSAVTLGSIAFPPSPVGSKRSRPAARAGTSAACCAGLRKSRSVAGSSVAAAPPSSSAPVWPANGCSVSCNTTPVTDRKSGV